ncbi:MAG: hypothetical protein ABIG42_12105, partial [bacterium]
GTFFELQNAGFIPTTYSDSDTEAHDLEPFIPYYEIVIVKSPTALTEDPDRNQYFVTAAPIGAPSKNLRIFMMQEDGEVYFFANNYDGQKYVWE